MSHAAIGAAFITPSRANQATNTQFSMSHENQKTPWPLATNVYPWHTFYKRQERDFEADLKGFIKEVKQNGIWTETFSDGDIDYQKLTNILTERGIRPLVTIEQAVEEKSLNTMNSLEAHKISHTQARKTFAPFLE
jgi:hypothetical protein